MSEEDDDDLDIDGSDGGPAQFTETDVAAARAWPAPAPIVRLAPTPAAAAGTPDQLIVQLKVQLLQARDAVEFAGVCRICLGSLTRPLVSTVCWHVACETCWLRYDPPHLSSLGIKKLCTHCAAITLPTDLRRLQVR